MKRFIPFVAKDPTVSVIRLSGVIAASARGGTLSDSALAPAIERAFAKGKPAAVALVLNSPGGSPAQSSLIAARIRRLAAEKKLPVHAFVEDVAASGGYWLACAADDIWVDDSSIVGSIGVISAGFGLHEAIARLGIERRVHTAGKDKSMLDPFRPERPEDVERLLGLQRQIHDSFIAHVRARRGARLSEAEDLFTGEFWVGARAVELGLADGIAHLVPKMKALYGDKVRFRDYGARRGLFQRFGAGLAAEMTAGIEDRALWSRFGLS
ncbi:S49 family peptidase [Roseicyclus persicicus]|uniref:S49 family peptidase n=1 Tax=Roseicyclus persicicus TaxID=2650661 RepID=A0A7X6JXI9_9RHOB|nr:S49 family peptidase [Roseibacterium persicicum]NKX45582.1 S49 family peptidase [Roseibacterium persicicum]